MTAARNMTDDAESRYSYRAYGLRVRSAIALPFQPCETSAGDVDVRIRVGTTPAGLGYRVRNKAEGVWESAPGALLLRLDGIARFLVSNGEDIVVEPDGGSEHDIAMSMLGSIFGAVLQQRHIATFHASAIATSAGAVLFLGLPGSGKSTAAAAMAKRGYAMLADDVTAVVLDAEGGPIALPAFPAMRLWDDALDALNWRDRAEQRVREGMRKYLVVPPRFHDAPLAIRALFSIGSTSFDSVALQPETASAAAGALLGHGFRKRFLRGLAQEATWFQTTAAMARRLPLTTIQRPVEPLLLDALSSCVEAQLDGADTAVAAD